VPEIIEEKIFNLSGSYFYLEAGINL